MGRVFRSFNPLRVNMRLDDNETFQRKWLSAMSAMKTLCYPLSPCLSVCLSVCFSRLYMSINVSIHPMACGKDYTGDD